MGSTTDTQKAERPAATDDILADSLKTLLDLKIALRDFPRSTRRFNHIRTLWTNQSLCSAPALLYDRALAQNGKGGRSYP